MIYQMADTAMNPKQTVFEIIGRPLEFYLGMQGEQKQNRVRQLLKMIELALPLYHIRQAQVSLPELLVAGRRIMLAVLIAGQNGHGHNGAAQIRGRRQLAVRGKIL